MAFLAVEIYKPPFTTIDELASQSEYKFGTLGGTIFVDMVSTVSCIESVDIQSIPKETHIKFQISLWPPWGRGAKNPYGRLCKWEFYVWSIFNKKNLPGVELPFT